MIPTVGDASPEMPGLAAAAPGARAPGTTEVLIVDEALPVRRTLTDILRKLGWNETGVVHASSADEALELFRRHAPRVVFAELVGVHPEDGLEVVHEMLDRDPSVKIVLLTAEPRESAEVRAAMRAGAFALVEKPLRHEKIRQVLQDLASEEGGIERLR